MEKSSANQNSKRHTIKWRKVAREQVVEPIKIVVGDVVVVACSNCQNFVDHEKLNMLTVRIQGTSF